MNLVALDLRTTVYLTFALVILTLVVVAVIATIVSDLGHRIGRQVIRTCPVCSVACSPGASECPHCGNTIVPWVFWSGTWWRRGASGWEYLRKDVVWERVRGKNVPTPPERNGSTTS